MQTGSRKVKYQTGCLFLFIFFFRQLCQDDGCKHDDTSKELFYGKLLIQEHPACKHGDAGFKRKDQRSNCGIHIFSGLRPALGVGNTAGHHTGIQDRQPCSENGRNLRMFQNKCRDHGQDSADQKLDTGKLYTVCLRRKNSQ